MSSFSVTDAAFAGFRLLRRRPGVVLAWAGYFFVAAILMGVLTPLLLTVSGAGEAFANLEAVSASSQNAAEVAAAIAQIGPLALIFLAINLAFTGIVFAAAYRAFLRPDVKTIGAFHVGGDELRLIGLLLLTFLAWAVYSAIVFFLADLLFAVASGLGQPLSGLIDIIVVLGVFPAFLYPWVRLSLAGPMTLDTGRVVLFRSWGLTHGHFWRLLGTYLLTFILLMIVALAAYVVIILLAAVLLVATGQGLSALLNPDQIGGGDVLAGVVALALQSLLSAVLLAVFVGPTAEAYRHLAHDEEDSFS